jgi:hypothetical protein
VLELDTPAFSSETAVGDPPSLVKARNETRGADPVVAAECAQYRRE